MWRRRTVYFITLTLTLMLLWWVHRRKLKGLKWKKINECSGNADSSPIPFTPSLPHFQFPIHPISLSQDLSLTAPSNFPLEWSSDRKGYLLIFLYFLVFFFFVILSLFILFVFVVFYFFSLSFILFFTLFLFFPTCFFLSSPISSDKEPVNHTI